LGSAFCVAHFGQYIGHLVKRRINAWHLGFQWDL
jgi:hypothetical protein